MSRDHEDHVYGLMFSQTILCLKKQWRSSRISLLLICIFGINPESSKLKFEDLALRAILKQPNSQELQ